MDYAPKMTNTEIFRWGMFKFQGVPNSKQVGEFEKLDSKWNSEKGDLITKAVQKLGLEKRG